jgi:hypothetical protein
MAQEITRALLLRAWKEVRGTLMRYSFRDALDFVEYDIDPEKWITRLVYSLRDGTYRPHPASVGYLTKSANGFRRQMSYPDIPDLTLYYALALLLYRRSKRQEQAIAFFDQKSLDLINKEIQREAEAEKKFAKSGWAALFEEMADYATASKRRFRTWLRYNQYRKRLAFRRVHRYVVITDITNFFDTIIHTHLNDCLNRFSTSPHVVRLIQLLLLSLKRHPESRPPDQVGIPTDESDASRMLAHMLLYEHDDRMVSAFGVEGYVRWMDDQNIGVSSRAEGVRAVQFLQESLRRLHLTANGSKTQILSIASVKRHFHFKTNEELDELERSSPKTRAEIRAYNKNLSQIWIAAKKNEGVGQWEKILARVYRAAAATKSRRFKRRVKKDVVECPGLCERALQYHRVTSSATEHRRLINRILDDEAIFGDDLVQNCFESLLTTEASGGQARKLRELAIALMNGGHARSRHKICLSAAPLLVFRFGDRRSVPSLRARLHRDWDGMLPLYRRSCAAVYVAMKGRPALLEITKLVAERRTFDMSVFCLTLDALLKRKDVHQRVKDRVQLTSSFASGLKTLDTRKTLLIKLISLNQTKEVQNWVRDKVAGFAPKVSSFERQWWKRLGL